MRCIICGSEVSLHEHHVIPQACGGRDGPTVMLCADHHNLIHYLAVRLVSALRQGKEVEFEWPEDQGDREVARYLVGEIVKATLNSKEKVYKLTLEFDPLQREMLGLLKETLGVSSLQKVVYVCLDYVFRTHLFVPKLAPIKETNHAKSEDS